MGTTVIKDFKVINVGMSDHLPIKIDLSNNNEYGEDIEEEENEIYKLKWDPRGEIEYKEILKNLNWQNKDTIDEEADNLREFIINAAKSTDMIQSIKTRKAGLVRNRPWYTAECKNMKKELNRYFRKWLRDKLEVDKELYIKTRKKYIDSVKNLKRKYMEEIKNKLINIKDNQTFWKTVNTFLYNKRHKIQITTAQIERFYVVIFPNRVLDTRNFTDCRHPVLDIDITPIELSRILNKLKINKAPGPDGIHNIFYKTLPINAKMYMLNMFNKILNTGNIPNSWTNFNQILLYKKGNPSDPMNYRGITLANSIMKIFTSILAARLGNWGERNSILPEGQAGFRPGRSCEDNLFVINAKVTIAFNKKGGRLFAAFVDFRRAFDSVVHNLLWYKLFKVGVSSQLIRIIKNIYEKANMKVMVNKNEKTNDIEITQGVLQGDSLSPTLFAMMLHDIAEFFKEKGHDNVIRDMELLLFADDLVLFAKDVIELQRKLDTLVEYCSINGLEVNIEKTKILIFKKAGRQKSTRSLKYKGIALEVVKKYTYLGVTLCTSGTFNQTVEYFQNKARTAMGTLWKPFIGAKMEGWENKMKLFEAIVESTLLYGSNIWGLKHGDEIEKIHTRFLKLLLALPQCTPGYLLRLETGRTRLDNKVLKRTLMYLIKILKMEENRFPKRCLILLKELDRNNDETSKYNWFSTLRMKLEKLNYNYIIETENYAILENEMDKILEKEALNSYISDTGRALASRFNPIYKYIKNLGTPTCEDYLLYTLPINYARNIAQCRLAGREQLIITHGQNLYTKLKEEELCLMCNSNKNESLKHLLIECPTYGQCNNSKIRANNFPQILNIPSLEQAKSFYYFIQSAMKLRAFCLNE